MKKIISSLALALCFSTGLALAGSSTAASSMHYGKSNLLSGSQYGSIVITNCSFQMASVSASFTDGSYNTMPIYPQGDYPENIISIDNAFPYVDIEINAADGTVLFPDQPVYPGQYIGIGCYTKSAQAKQTVVVK